MDARPFSESGLEDVKITTHEVLLPWPEEVSVEMTAPKAWRASMREDPIAGDQYTQIAAGRPGCRTTPTRRPAKSRRRSSTRAAAIRRTTTRSPPQGIDIRGKIALVRYSVPYSYRGFKALTAQQRGAAGILIYSDPADDGSGKGTVYPKGPWGPPSHIQRGGIVYDFMVPGDPLTPGWASLPGARRIDRDERSRCRRSSARRCRTRTRASILEAMGGPEAPKNGKGRCRSPIAWAARPRSACASDRRRDPADLDGDRHDPRQRATRTTWSSSATIATRGSTAASIRRAGRRR